MLKKKYLTIFSHLLTAVLFTMLSVNCYGEVLFEDNFNSHQDWSPTQPIYPDSIVCKPDGSGACNDMPTGWNAYRIQGSPYTTAGNNTLVLDSTNARGGSGKGMTYWCESGGTSTWWSDGMLTKTFTPENEVYVAFWVKFKDGYQFPAPGDLFQQKIFRIGHLSPDDYTYYPTQQPYNEPQVIFDLVKAGQTPVLGDLGVLAAVRNHPDYYFDYSPYNVGVRQLVWGGSSYSPTGTGFSRSGLEDGEWHYFQFYVKLNSSAGSQDGVFKFWQNDTLLLSYDAVAWIETGGDMNRKWNFFSIGGNVFNHYSDSENKDEQWYAYDDVVLSTTYISLDYVITEPVISPIVINSIATKEPN